MSCDVQVIKECKQRNRMEFVETSADCELIPSQMYKLSGQPVSCIQPEVSDAHGEDQPILISNSTPSVMSPGAIFAVTSQT